MTRVVDRLCIRAAYPGLWSEVSGDLRQRCPVLIDHCCHKHAFAIHIRLNIVGRWPLTAIMLQIIGDVGNFAPDNFMITIRSPFTVAPVHRTLQMTGQKSIIWNKRQILYHVQLITQPRQVSGLARFFHAFTRKPITALIAISMAMTATDAIPKCAQT